MSDVISRAQGGREASLERRRALSAGKAALPPAGERVRVGVRHAAVVPAAPAPAPIVFSPAPAAAAYVAPAPLITKSGRGASIERRRMLSAGKAALGGEVAVRAPVAAPSEPSRLATMSGRSASLERRRMLSAGKAAVMGLAPAPAAPAAAPQPIHAADACTSGSCKDQARARRAMLSRGGRSALQTSSAGAQHVEITRQGSLDYAPKVITSATQRGQRVTGSRIGRGQKVTGDERGTIQPVSGTQYIDHETGGAARPVAPKVGLARTERGLVVSGTLVRSQVRITGDEAGRSVAITGKADQRVEDDLTARAADSGMASAQFARQANPHGTTVHGTNLGRFAGHVGSRQRTRGLPIEATESGKVITGSAVGRSLRVTGDETGACRAITGSQYLAPARRQADCGHPGGGTAPAAQLGTDRPDPVTGSKVTLSKSWAGQTISGLDLEHDPRVTGDAPGSCAPLTGSQYQGPRTVQGWCDPAAAGAAAGRRAPHAGAAVTGNTTRHDEAVTGTARGAGRDITGTPYYRADAAAPAPLADPVQVQADRFSVHSPQRVAHLSAAQSALAETAANDKITGSFAVGTGKVTGNFEFVAKPRGTGGKDRKPAHARISGEGRVTGAAVTGQAWTEQQNVTGTEGSFATERNPSERAGERQNFAGAGAFKRDIKPEEPKQLVTGMFGYFSKSGARVTLSGGA